MKRDEKEVITGVICWIAVGILMPIMVPFLSGIIWWIGIALIAHGAGLGN